MRIGTDEPYEVIEPNTYPATCVEWTDVDQFGKPLMSMGFADSEPKPQYRIKFALEVDGLERFLSAWINKPEHPDSVHPRAKLVELAKAILGDKAATTDWEVADFVEGTLRVQVEVYQRKDGTEANKISRFYPAARARREAGAERAPAAAGAGKPPF